MTQPNPDDTMFTIARADGEEMFDEYTWRIADHFDDWDNLESDMQGKPTEYVMTEWRAVRTTRRVIEPSAEERSAYDQRPWPARWDDSGEPDDHGDQ